MNMNGELARWEQRQREIDLPWMQGYSYYPPSRPASRTRTSPITTRTRIDRHASQERPTSSGADRPLPSRQKRRITSPRGSSLHEFRITRTWPPKGYGLDLVMNPSVAEELVCSGTSTFKGYFDEIPNAPKGHYHYYAVMDAEHAGRNDRAIFQHDAFGDISLTPTGPADSAFPWVSLEQPCMAYCFGKSPGTTTLNFKVGKSGSLRPPVQITSNIKPKRVKLLHILDRLQQLEMGLEEDDPEVLYDYLYTALLDDPDKHTEDPHFGMEMQITDLITVLSHPDWVDFSLPKNQVVAKFFDSSDPVRKHNFFHQLLLSVELYLRIHSREHQEKAKRKLLMQLPSKIAWDLALAQRWLENMSITRSRTSTNQSTFSFELRSKKRQKEALRTFAMLLKWPNMDEIGYILDEKDRKEKAVEDRSADAMSWFTGVVLPGVTLPWLLMNSLIDCDRDTGDALRYLTHIHPASGFQYRANTYWSYQCIVGKVLGAARGVNQVAGWIGPCNYTPDLKRTECVRILQLEPPELRLTPQDVQSMDRRTQPLGQEYEDYPVEDYELLLPDLDEVTDAIRVEKLSFQPCREQPASVARMGANAPLTFDAAIIFACGGESWPMRLRYDVDFIFAYPCHQGPHVIFYDYEYRAIKVDDGLVDIHDWGPKPPQSSSHRSSSRHSSTSSSRSRLAFKTSPRPASPTEPASDRLDKVLAIEALGVSDNEVFARAWCAHWGLSAIIANINETCMACSIREAYAACISVVILTQGGRPGEEDEGVNG